MANYINKYATQSDYDSDNTKQYPNTSYVVATDEVIFKMQEEAFGGLTVKYDIDTTLSEFALFNVGGGSSSSGSSSSESGSGSGGGGVMPTKMYIDGVEETPIDTWRFDTTGEHIVQYEFEGGGVPNNFLMNITTVTEVIIGSDMTSINDYSFYGLSITSVEIPDSVQLLGEDAFYGCTLLEDATIGTGIITINTGAFGACTSLAILTVEATTPPALDGDLFPDLVFNGTIYVPAESVSAYQTAWSSLASRIQAIS